MKSLRYFAIIGFWIPAIAFAWPWSTDMMNQPSIKPQEVNAGEKSMREFPTRSIPIQGIPTKIKTREEARNLSNPVEATQKSINTGRTLFRIYCAACHGKTGAADSPVSGKIGAVSLRQDYIQNYSDGWIYGTITLGSYVMPAYGAPALRPDKRGSNDLNIEERWNVVNYVKHGLLKD